MSGDFTYDPLKGERGAVEQVKGPGNSLQGMHPIPFPHTRAMRLAGPRSWSRSDCLIQWGPGWLPRGNSRSSRSKLCVCPECTCGVHDSGCKYAAVEEQSS